MTGAEPPLARVLAEFAAGLTYDDLPAAITDQAKHLVLDALGVAFASTTFEFASIAASALQSLGTGDHPVIGLRIRLPLRDAAMLNGVLIHGLDFDDTHLSGVVHVSAAALPAALAMAADGRHNGRELLLAYVLGVEIAARIGCAAAGGFHRAGFHPTGVAGAFGSAVAAARLDGHDAAQIAAAQGFVGSLASGTLEFAATGAWTKRAHAGWAATCGITASAFARHAFVSPEHVYEGRHGLFHTHLPGGEEADLHALTHALGEQWQIRDVAVKLYPSCHFTHAFVDAALEVMQAEAVTADEIEDIRCLIHRDAVPIVCEPRHAKLRPQSDYEAKFSLPFVVAATLVHGRFSLNELDDDVLQDPRVLALAARVTDEDDPQSGYPHAYSGEIVVRTKSGRVVRRREQVNRGAPGRPIAPADVITKFRANAELARIDDHHVDRVIETVLTLERCADVRALVDLLAEVRA
jgi:2-methylcitrate dehydratase PrpD